MTDLWTEASRDVEAEILDRHLTAARVAAAPLWPFLAAAVSPEDYANRKALSADKIERIAQAAAQGDPSLFGVVHAGLLDGLDSDFTVLHTERTAKRIEAETKTRAEQQREAALRARIEAETVRRVLAANDAEESQYISEVRSQTEALDESIPLTNVGIEGEYGVGTDPSGNRVKFHLSDKDKADLKAVLYSDLAVNFSGVTISRSDLVTSASRKTAGNPYPVGDPAWFRWENGEGDPASYGPGKGTPDDLFPNGVPLHGDLTPEQQAWLDKRSKRVAARIDDLRKIVADKQYGMVEGMTMDIFTASHLIAVHDALSPENQAKFDSIPLPRLVDFAFKATGARKQADANPFAKKDGDSGAKKPADNADAGAPDPVGGQNDVWTCPNCQSTDAYTQGGKNLDEALKASEPIKCGSCQQVDTTAGQQAQDPQQQAPNQAPVATASRRSRHPFAGSRRRTAGGLDGFWEEIHRQYEALKNAKSADDVIRILGTDPELQDGNAAAFFAGSGGDEQVIDALSAAGWRITWAEADYYFVAQAPDGSKITYVEGDVYKGDTRTASRRQAGVYRTPVGAGWDLLKPGDRIKVGFEESVSTGTFVRIDANSNPDFYGDTPVIVYTDDVTGRERTYLPHGGESPRKIGSHKQAEGEAWDHGLGEGEGQVYSCFLDADCPVIGTAAEMEKHYETEHLDSPNRDLMRQSSRRTAGVVVPVDGASRGITYYESPSDVPDQYGAMTPTTLYTVVDAAGEKYHGEPVKILAGPFLSWDKASRVEMQKGDWYGWDGIETREQTVYPYDRERHTRWGSTQAASNPSEDERDRIRRQNVPIEDVIRATVSDADEYLPDKDDDKTSSLNASFASLVTAGNPYQPTDNPYTNDPPIQPGTPDDVLDGPADTNPLAQMDAPVTTRPRQQPSGAPAENTMAPAPEPTSVTTKPKAAARGFASTAFKRIAGGGIPGDPTPFGVGGDHCPFCGVDWKQPHDGDCLRNTSPAAAAAQEAEGEKALEAENARWRAENPGPHTCPICGGSGQAYGSSCRNCGGKGSWTYTAAGPRNPGKGGPVVDSIREFQDAANKQCAICGGKANPLAHNLHQVQPADGHTYKAKE